MRFVPRIAALALAAGAAAQASAVVYISEIFPNPAGAFDDTHEFIELTGTPNKKLDGYAIAFFAGGITRFYPLGTVTGPIDNVYEMDEFFSLDGLSLGPNGILLLGIGPAGNYVDRATDSAVRANWGTGIWNGYKDTVGKLDNDGSKTAFLIRNRPGATQATNPNPPAQPTLRWGKDINVDTELVTPVLDGQTMMMVDQYGEGDIDDGGPTGYVSPANTMDLKGKTTPQITDDLEIVDELSWEQDRGWEYDQDERHVDDGSTVTGLPYRHVHALDDPQGFNPDCVTRVDYRTKGNGWTPSSGGTGEMMNGNNWQDTATEQWIRGESVSGAGPRFYYSNEANTNPDSIQPFVTNVPLWLADGQAPDFSFALNGYQITPGQMNPLAIAFIPGDSDRDGDADAEDIQKIAAVFGNDNWIFSNSFAGAPEGDGGDPAAQTRPWDVDATGNNGIEPSDLQWTLNFQGNTNGRIVGVSYTSAGATPAGQGVYLNSNAGVQCVITASVASSRGSAIVVGDTVTVDVSVLVSAGANSNADHQNGVMQFVNDALLSTGGVLRVTNIESIGAFSTTRADIQALQGASGDGGVRRINGYTTSFTEGLAAPAPAYRITLLAVGEGSTSLTIGASTEAKFAASTPRGLKVGHTNNTGNPATATYPAPIQFTVQAALACCIGNANGDTIVDFDDIVAVLGNWLEGSVPSTPNNNGDADCDGDVDFDDIVAILGQWLNPC